MVNLWFVHGIDVSAVIVVLKNVKKYQTDKDHKMDGEAVVQANLESQRKPMGKHRQCSSKPCSLRKVKRKKSDLHGGRFKSPLWQKMVWNETGILTARYVIEDAGQAERGRVETIS